MSLTNTGNVVRENMSALLPSPPQIPEVETIEAMISSLSTQGLRDGARTAMTHLALASKGHEEFSSTREAALNALTDRETRRLERVASLTSEGTQLEQEKQEITAHINTDYARFKQLTAGAGLTIEPTSPTVIADALSKDRGLNLSRIESARNELLQNRTQTPRPQYPDLVEPALPEELPITRAAADNNRYGENNKKSLMTVFICVLVGMVFGGSLGIVTGFLDMDMLGRGEIPAIIMALIFGTIGTGIIYGTANLLRRNYKHLAEVNAGTLPRDGNTLLAGILLGFGVLLMFAEAAVDGIAIHGYAQAHNAEARLIPGAQINDYPLWVFMICAIIISWSAVLYDISDGFRSVGKKQGLQGDLEKIYSDQMAAHEKACQKAREDRTTVCATLDRDWERSEQARKERIAELKEELDSYQATVLDVAHDIRSSKSLHDASVLIQPIMTGRTRIQAIDVRLKTITSLIGSEKPTLPMQKDLDELRRLGEEITYQLSVVNHLASGQAAHRIPVRKNGTASNTDFSRNPFADPSFADDVVTA